MNTPDDSHTQPPGSQPELEVEHVLDSLRPRMRAARIRHVRMMGAALAVIPMMGLGALVLGQSNGESISVASGPVADDAATADDPAGTDIADAFGDQKATTEDADEPDTDGSGDGVADASDDGPTAADGSEPEVHEVDMASYGHATVEIEGDGGLVLVDVVISEPWELVSAEVNDEGDLVITVTDGEITKVITIGEGLWDEIHVKVDELEPPAPEPVPTTTTTKPAPKPEPEPDPVPPVVERVVLEVPPAGSFVAEREGETLFGGNVQPNAGFEFDIISAQGWKVHVAFFNETHVYHGKVYIDDNGATQTKLWTEERVVVPEPVYQWVEIPNVGAVKFKYFDGLMYVKEITSAVGFGSYIYNEVGETVKVDFEGEGQLWIVEAWAVEGVIQWSTVGPDV